MNRRHSESRTRKPLRGTRILTQSTRSASAFLAVLTVATLGLALCRGRVDAAPASAARPNVIVILADDLGYHDLGVQGATDVITTNIDSIARNGIRFTSGYVTAPLCSPSRAGLITGRYQQRFGHETNPGVPLEKNPIFGLPLTESTIANRLKNFGYATGWIGKSHLGGTAPFHPLERGFDEFFGFIEGHHHYLNPGIPTNQTDPILSGHTIVRETNYLTYAFAREITNFVARHANESFFLYAPFNAVHDPLEATPQLLGRFTNSFADPNRRIMAAMLAGLDDAVGLLLNQLRALNLETNTLIFFTSDNGAPTPINGSVNTPFRGYKTQPYEGGIRVPFLMQWKGTLPANVTYDPPVSTLDILPTAVAAAGEKVPAAWQLDGVNLLPFLLGQTTSRPHTNLFWRLESDGGGIQGGSPDGIRAVRQEDWKLLKGGLGFTWELYNLALDPGETNDLADARPDKVRELVALYESWAAELAQPLWAYETLPYERPAFIPEDFRVGATNVSYLAPEFLDDGTFTFIDGASANRLWQGSVDPSNGFLRSLDGRERSLDTGVSAPTGPADRPQWGRSANGPAVYYPKADAFGRRQISRARVSGNTVTVTPLTAVAGAERFGVRVGDMAGSSSIPLAFQAGTPGNAVPVWADESAPAIELPLPFPAPGSDAGRWIPDSKGLVYVAQPATSASPQLALFQATNGSVRILTDDASEKFDAWPFRAPEFGGEWCYAAILDRTAIGIYRDPGTGTNSVCQRVATLTLTNGAPQQFLYSLRPVDPRHGFNGISYFVCAAYANKDPDNPGDSGIWLFGLGPDTNNILTRRLDLNAGGVSSPDSGRRTPIAFVGNREVYCYYTRIDASGVSQLRMARTGLRRPDFPDAPTGFTRLEFEQCHTSGTNDAGNRWMSGTETMAMAVHQGRLFAGTGNRQNLPYPTNSAEAPPTWTGAQILVKDGAESLWRVDPIVPEIFRFHARVEALEEITVTTRANGSLLPAPQALLVAGLSDLGSTGSDLASTRTRVEGSPEGWVHAHVATTVPPANVLALGSHIETDTGIHLLFAGLENGEIYPGVYNGGAPARISWLSNSVEFAGGGPITQFAECAGLLFAASALRQDTSNGPIRGGLYARRDASNTWSLVYRWNPPAAAFQAPLEFRQASGLTPVLNPSGLTNEVLLLARSWPGVIERLDPSSGFKTTVELDVRDFFARRWNDDRVRTQAVSVGYTRFTPALDPVTGQPVHLIGLWLNHPDSTNPLAGGTHFLIRHRDGTYEAADVPRLASAASPDAAPSLRATRCLAPAPFAQESGNTIYLGGYDTGSTLSSNTAWILRARWKAWPTLELSQPNPPDWQLSWDFAATNWIAESALSLGNATPTIWQPVPGIPTRSITKQTLVAPAPAPAEPDPGTAFFRLRRVGR